MNKYLLSSRQSSMHSRQIFKKSMVGGVVALLTMPSLSLANTDQSYQSLRDWIDNSRPGIESLTVGEHLTIKGSKLHDDYQSFRQDDDVYDNQLEDVIRKSNAAEELGDEILVEMMDSLYTDIDSLRGIFVENYLLNNPTSLVSSFVLVMNSYRYDLDQLEAFFGKFSDEVATSEYGEYTNKMIVSLNKSREGMPAPLFTMKDQDDHPVTLEEFQGNYLLIDFWASWCGPCRVENPNLVEAYAKYHTEGLEILGISLDKKKDRWLNAIVEDQLTWIHVSDLQGWANAVAKQYAVSSIPHSVLVDEKGIIVAKNLRGEDLLNKLEEIYGQVN